MAEKDPKDMDNFERAYAVLKQNRVLPLTESSYAQKDAIITQFLSKNFNGESAIRTDHLGRDGFFAPLTSIDIEQKTIRDNTKDLTSQNPADVLENKNNKLYVIEKLIANAPSLRGLDLNTARDIQSGDLTRKDITTKFPDTDPHIIQAAAYTLLNAHKEAAPNGKPDDDLKDMIGLNLLYAQKNNPEYDAWSQAKQNEVIAAITSSPEIMRDLKSLRCPENISTTEELEEQFAARQRIAGNMTDIFAKAYGMIDTLHGGDAHIIYKSREKMLNDPALAHLSAFQPGIVNDETIIFKYNPVTHLTSPNISTYTTTDKAEAQQFIEALSEELVHTVDHIMADRAVLGTMPPNTPVEQHAIAFTLNSLYRETVTMNFPKNAQESDIYQAQHDKYAAQYIENTAKTAAEKISNTVLDAYDAPLPEAKAALPTTAPAETSTLDRLIQKINPFGS